jgi:hypothetical protein
MFSKVFEKVFLAAVCICMFGTLAKAETLALSKAHITATISGNWTLSDPEAGAIADIYNSPEVEDIVPPGPLPAHAQNIYRLPGPPEILMPTITSTGEGRYSMANKQVQGDAECKFEDTKDFGTWCYGGGGGSLKLHSSSAQFVNITVNWSYDLDQHGLTDPFGDYGPLSAVYLRVYLGDGEHNTILPDKPDESWYMPSGAYRPQVKYVYFPGAGRTSGLISGTTTWTDFSVPAGDYELFSSTGIDLGGYTTSVPEPNAVALLALGVLCLTFHGWRRRKGH